MLKFDVRPTVHALGADGTMTAFQWVDGVVRSVPPYVMAWWFFTAAVLAANIQQIFPEISGPASYFLTVAGTGGCGWAWLLSRTLFRPSQPIERWVILVIAAIIAVESPWALSAILSNGAPSGELHRIIGNAASLVCISALFLVLLEALSGYGALTSRSERRFRQMFVGGYAALISVSMLWAINAVDGTFAGHWQDAALMSCGLAGIILTRIAVSYRKRNPLIAAEKQSRVRSLSATAAGDEALAQRILAKIADEEIFTTPNLKVADFSHMLGEHDYKVTQCVTGRLNYRNFNHLVNTFRIRLAKQALSLECGGNQPILSIAYDCGFNSIGPFNRAFRQEVGMTPREFRMSRIAQQSAASIQAGDQRTA